jgi:hypothetical protein
MIEDLRQGFVLVVGYAVDSANQIKANERKLIALGILHKSRSGIKPKIEPHGPRVTRLYRVLLNSLAFEGTGVCE